jgi:hypothetical protein
MMVLVSSMPVSVVPATQPASPATRPATVPVSQPVVVASPVTRPAPVQTTPQLAVVVKTHNPTLMLSATDQIFNILAGFVAIHKITGAGPGAELRQESYHGLVLHRLDLGLIVPEEPAKNFPGWKLELAWTQANDYLVISSSISLLHQLMDRAFISPADAAGQKRIFSQLPDTVHWAMSIDPAKAGEDMKLFREVLIHFWQGMSGEAASQYLQDIPVVLGIGTKVVKGEDPKRTIVQVAGVLPGYPAWHHLQVGDLILSINGEPIDPASPLKDMHKKISACSQNAQSIKMDVLRSNQKVQVEIPLSSRNFTLSVKAMSLLEKILHTMARDFTQIELACTYTPEGQIHLVFNFIPIPSPSPTSAPVK